MTYTWDTGFLTTPDRYSGIERYTGQYVNQFREAVDERVSVEHNFSTADVAPQANHGIHLPGSSLVYLTDTEPIKTPGGLTLGTSDTGRLWRTTDGQLKKWTGTAWVEVVTVTDDNVAIDSELSASNLITPNEINISGQDFTFDTAVYNTAILTSGATWVIPEGFYEIFAPRYLFEVYIDGDGWKYNTSVAVGAGLTIYGLLFIVSDGSNMRFNNRYTGSLAYYYRKLSV